MHRTTIRLDEHLLMRVKEYAVQRQISLTAVIEEALVVHLARPPAGARPKRRIRLPVSKEVGGPLPGVDLNSYSALLDRMEEGLSIDNRR